MKYLILVISALFLIGCSAFSKLSAYSVTQNELETILDRELVARKQRGRILGIPVLTTIDDMSVVVGPGDREVVQLDSVATTRVEVFGLTYDARIKLTLEGQPYYDKDKKAIFMRSLELLDSKVDAGGYRGSLAPLSRELMYVLNRYLTTHPVYRLDTSNPAVNMLTRVPMTLHVERDKLVLRPES